MTHFDARSAQASGAEERVHPDGGASDLTHGDAAAASRRSRRIRPAFVDEASDLLTTQVIGRAMRAFTEVDSTNTLAAQWVDDDAPHGAVVVADHQTRGRGRLGRSWIALAGVNLTFSVVIRPDLPSDRLGMLTVAACTGVAQAIDRFADPLRTSIKWPNDIYLNGRKLCGMLLEASWNVPGRKPAVVLGIGLNVNQDQFPEAIRERATSLLVETGRVIPRAEVFAAVLSDLERALSRLDLDEEDVRRDYVDRMMSLDDEICLRFADEDRKVAGVVQGIDGTGGIILETPSGRFVYHAGEVTRAV